MDEPFVHTYEHMHTSGRAVDNTLDEVSRNNSQRCH